MSLSLNESLPILENPFIYGPPIRNRLHFFGRAKETQKILQRLRKDECVSIVGPRRIGKTSLLFHLCDLDVHKQYGLGPEYLFVYLDCQSMGDVDKTQFFQMLGQKARETIAEQQLIGDWTHSISNFGKLSSVMTAIRKRGYKFIFLLDEFETVVENPHLDQDSFSKLRSLCPTVTYAIASHESISELTDTATSILSSEFFNIFAEENLGFLSPEEAEEMIGTLLRLAGQKDLFSERDFGFVFDIAGYHPFFIQLVSSHLFEHKTEQVIHMNYEDVRQRYVEDAVRYFRYAWKHLKQDEREMAYLACEGRVNQLSVEQKRLLRKKSILDGERIFSSAFAEYVLAKHNQTTSKGINLESGADQNSKEELIPDLLPVEYQTRLRRKLSLHFSEEELRTLLFEVDVDYDNLPGGGKDGKTREIVGYFMRRQSLSDLVSKCQELRPSVDWEQGDVT